MLHIKVKWKKCRPTCKVTLWIYAQSWPTGPRSAVGNVSGYRCVSDCRSRGREFDLGPVPYFRGDWSWNNFYGHSPPFRWFIQKGLFSVTSESMCTNYWLTACSSLPRKSVVRWTDRPAMTIAVDLGRKATKPTNQQSWPLRFGLKVRYWNCADVSIFFIELSTKTYLTGVCYDLNGTVGELRVR